MPNFDWRIPRPGGLANRFADSFAGYPAWRELVIGLQALGTDPCAPDSLDLFDQFLKHPTLVAPIPRECRVFVSHRRPKPDVDYAERIAFEATRLGYTYWLDVHDPQLAYLEQGPPVPSPAK